MAPEKHEAIWAWGSVRIFGHHVAAPSVVLAGLDGALFLAALRLLSIEQHCSICYFNSLVSSRSETASILAAIFVLLVRLGRHLQRRCARSFRTFVKRFAVAWQLIFVLAVGFFRHHQDRRGPAVRLVRGHPVARHRHLHDGAADGALLLPSLLSQPLPEEAGSGAGPWRQSRCRQHLYERAGAATT